MRQLSNNELSTVSGGGFVYLTSDEEAKYYYREDNLALGIFGAFFGGLAGGCFGETLASQWGYGLLGGAIGLVATPLTFRLLSDSVNKTFDVIGL
jgi:bacteriocin-like protein